MTHSDREIEYPLEGYMYKDIHPEIYEILHPLVYQLFHFTPKNNYQIKWRTCIVAAVATRKQPLVPTCNRPKDMQSHIPMDRYKGFGRRVKTITDHSFPPPTPPPITPPAVQNRLFPIHCWLCYERDLETRFSVLPWYENTLVLKVDPSFYTMLFP